MANNRIQVKRTSTSGRTPNTTNSGNAQYIAAGELALNMSDGILYSSNGSSVIEVGANNTNQRITGTLTVNAISANGGVGTAGQTLTSNGTGVYWASGSGTGTVTSVDSGDGLTGGPITSTGTLSVGAANGITVSADAVGVTQGTGVVVNATGVHVNSTYIATLTSNNTSFVGSVSAANVVSNAQLSSNLANYQTTAGLASNVATLTSNNSTFAYGKTEGTLNVNSALYANASITNTFTVGTASYFVANGNVGIGTITPASKLDIGGAGSSAAGFVTNPALGIKGDVYFEPGAGVDVELYNYRTTSIKFGTGGAEKVRIDASGNVGIGNTTPAHKLSVNGTTNLAGAVTGITTLAAGNTTITGFVNASAGVNSVSYNVGATVVANTTGTYATFVNGKTEGNLNVNSATTALTANNSTNLGGVAAASYQLNSTLSANVATLTANNTSFVGAVSAANVVSNAQLSGNLANYVTTTNLTNNLSNYQTTAGLAANVATLTANNANFVRANNGITSNATGVYVTQGTGIVVNSTGVHVNSTHIGTLTANNTSFVGFVSAANVVSNAQLSGNLANYQTTAGLASNVATLTSNNSTHAFGKTEGNLNVNNALTANNSTNLGGVAASGYQTTAGLSANVATLTSNNTSFVGSVSAANVVSNAQLSGNLANYAALGGATFTGAVTVSNDLTVTGNLTLSGNTVIVGANNLVVQDAIISLHTPANLAQLTSNDGKNIGLAFHYYDTEDKHALLYRDNTTGRLQFHNDGGDPQTNTNPTGNNLGTIQANNFWAGNDTVYATTNSTVYTGTANNTSFVGSVSAANVVSNAQLSSNLANYQTTAGLAANVATLTSNNSTFSYGKTEGALNVNSATTALTANNSTNLGGVAASNYARTDVARTFAGITTFSANIILNSSGLSANGGFGTAGHVLHSNGTATYWAADDNSGGTVTSITMGNGLSSTQSPLTTSGTISVVAGTSGGLVSNSTGVFVTAGSGLVTNATGLHVGTGNGVAIDADSIRVVSGNSQLISNSTGIWLDQTQINHNLLTNYVADQHVAHSTITLTAGAGLTGGGTIAANRTFDVGAGNGIAVDADSIRVVAGTGGGLVSNSTGVFVTQGTGTVVNATGVHVNATYIGTITSNNATFAFGKTEGALNVNNATTAYGKTEGNLNVNSATTSLTANNATNLGGIAAANYARTDVARTFAGITTFSANVVLGTSGLSANGGFGTAGQTLHSNGSATYWAADDNSGGTVTSVVAGTGLSGGTITTTGTLSVNASYIATIASNSALYANASITNTFTVGTSTYFVSNGNVGIGNTAPAHKLSINGSGFFNGTFGGGTQFYNDTSSARGKISLYGAGSVYAIGMQSGVTFGGLNDWAMTFQFNTTASRGFWWGHDGHSVAQGAMALTNDGRLTVAKSMRLGFGESDAVDPGTDYTLSVNGSFAATTKSFVINHPTKPDMKLRYGSLEGPENGVYVRGKSNTSIIELPEHWTGLVDEDTITVTLTPIGKKQRLYVKEIKDNAVVVGGAWRPNYYYTVFAERKDVDKLIVEY